MHAQHRLKASADFERVRKEGRSWGHPLLVLHAVPADGATLRCGFSVSKRVGPAVARNVVKRRLREIVRRALPQLRSGSDLVFTARSGAAAADYATLDRVVHQLLRRARLLAAPDTPLVDPDTPQ